MPLDPRTPVVVGALMSDGDPLGAKINVTPSDSMNRAVLA
jgi:hypothetical protein